MPRREKNKEHYEQLYAHKFNILEELDQFLDKDTMPNLT